MASATSSFIWGREDRFHRYICSEDPASAGGCHQRGWPMCSIENRPDRTNGGASAYRWAESFRILYSAQFENLLVRIEPDAA
jgi:hypothetical protein